MTANAANDTAASDSAAWLVTALAELASYREAGDHVTSGAAGGH